MKKTYLFTLFIFLILFTVGTFAITEVWDDYNWMGYNITNVTNVTGGYGFFDYVGVGTTTIVDTVTISGAMDLIHTAIEADDHAFEIEVDASGFGDVKGIDLFYDTGTIALGQDEAIFLINLDESEATGGDVFGIEMLATEGSADVYGLKAGALVGPIHQDSGTFTDMDSANNTGVDDLANFTSSTADIPIFVNDDDYIIIGDAAKFEELEFLLNTTASNPGIKPTFEYSTGTHTWATFTPVDGTNGMRNNGIVAWEDDDIPSWATGVGSEYLIMINRTQNNLVTVPIEDKVQIAAVTEYIWSKYGDLRIRNMNISKINTTNVSADYFINATGDLDWIRSENIYDVDDEDIETDLNTYLDVAGDNSTVDATFFFVNNTFCWNSACTINETWNGTCKIEHSLTSTTEAC